MKPPIVRLYFNVHGPKPWSIDFGTQETEIKVNKVYIENVSGHVTYIPELKETGPDVPVAWVIFYNAEVVLTREGTVATIVSKESNYVRD